MSNDPRRSVIELTLVGTTFEEDLEFVARAGGHGLGIAESKLRDGEDDQHLAALRASGLTATGCIPTAISPLQMSPPNIFGVGPDDPDARVAQMCASVRRLAAFGADSIAVLTGSGAAFSGDARQVAVEGIREAARVAKDHGTRLVLEPTRRDLPVDISFVHDIPEAIAFLDEVCEPALGLCYDVFHLWDTDDLLAQTGRHAGRVFSVQYDYWTTPGELSPDFPEILAALEHGGYAGWYELEVLRERGQGGERAGLPPAELMKRGWDGFSRAWAGRQPA